ncbi:hypothetical protein SAY86_020111 [Trapa natans]|uniref:peptidylprolyl isomerase n=1 Tax=Trapa natans TaxID=22666 RepID=A0AAN7R3W2_TRANT|nr:hypothetical protein SAY86_020111 [Trapa natans]
MAIIMEAAITSPLLPLYPKVVDLRQTTCAYIPNVSSQWPCISLPFESLPRKQNLRIHRKLLPPTYAVTSGTKDADVSSSQFEDFSISTTYVNDHTELKVNVEVSGAKTREIFDNVFDKMIAAAQPIPGFRREKGGKIIIFSFLSTSSRDILLEVLGPSKVYKQVIKTIINSAISKYVLKNNLKVSKNLKVEQSYEDLEAIFEPDETFSFDAMLQLIEPK